MGQELSQVYVNQLTQFVKSASKGPNGDQSDLVLQQNLERWMLSSTEFSELRAAPYYHYRTSIGSPSTTRRSLTEEDLCQSWEENDGFPTPATEEELRSYDNEAFVPVYKEAQDVPAPKDPQDSQEQPEGRKEDTAPTASPRGTKTSKILSPTKPRFLEHLISRVSRKVTRKNPNGLVLSLDDSQSLDPEEKLSPNSEKQLNEACGIVQDLFACSKRPPSGESSDSGKGSLIEATSDFSPTAKRKSWSTPSSPTFHGIVKQRLKSFEQLDEESDDQPEGAHALSLPNSPDSLAKPFHNSGQIPTPPALNIGNVDLKRFYCSLSQDGKFTAAVMSKGYVRALVERINEHHCLNEENGDICEDSSSKDKLENSVSEDIHAESNNTVIENGPSETETAEEAHEDHKENHVEEICSRSGPKTTIFDRTGAQEDEAEEEPKDRLHKIAHELLTTERSYVEKLHLLDQVFHFKVTNENKNGNFIPNDIIPQIFSNIKTIYQFHNDFLLPQLEDRLKNWSSQPKIGDLMKKNAPFLKLYSQYVKDFDHSMELINIWTQKSPRFAAVIQEVQKSPESCQLTLQHHMLGPIQRVPRYEMLLKDYLKHLPEDSSDRDDAQAALDRVTEAAKHSNLIMTKLENFHKLLTIRQSLTPVVEDLISPTRELIKEGRIIKISARSGEKQDRYLFLFNDMLLVCTETLLGAYNVRARLSVESMEILLGENMSIPNTFCVKSTEKTVEFLDENSNEDSRGWFEKFNQVVKEFRTKVAQRQISISETYTLAEESTLGQKAPLWVKDDAVTMCRLCETQFTALKRRHHCRACGHVVCGKCSARKVQLPYDNNQLNRVCKQCYTILSQKSASNVTCTSPNKTGTLQVSASEPAVLSGYLSVSEKGKNWTRRWIALREDFVLWEYKAHQDPSALATHPLPGYKVIVIGEEERLEKSNVFKIEHTNSNVNMFFQAESEEQLKHWVRVLEKMVVFELPCGEDVNQERFSSNSGSSCGSNNSETS